MISKYMKFCISLRTVPMSASTFPSFHKTGNTRKGLSLPRNLQLDVFMGSAFLFPILDDMPSVAYQIQILTSKSQKE